jgi:hypothetical protein
MTRYQAERIARELHRQAKEARNHNPEAWDLVNCPIHAEGFTFSANELEAVPELTTICGLSRRIREMDLFGIKVTASGLIDCTQIHPDVDPEIKQLTVEQRLLKAIFGRYEGRVGTPDGNA